MKISHVVSRVIMEAYVPTPEELEVMEEADRVIFPAADFDWDSNIVPKLKDLAILRLSLMFDLVQPLTDTLQQDVNSLMEVLPIDVDLKLTVPLIFYEIYWERCCRGRWIEQIFIPRPSFGFWKATYLTRFIEEYLETSLPEEFDIDYSEELATLISDYVTILNIKQLQVTKCPPLPNCTDGVVRDECIRPDKDIPLDHIPLERALRSLKNLTDIRLVFCMHPLAANFDWRAFRFSVADCELICAGLGTLPALRVLRINKCELDDIRSKIFFRFVGAKDSIEEIDFSHCYVGDEGLIALGGLLLIHQNLKTVRMRNNTFGEAGLKGLCHALIRGPKSPLVTLDLGLNFMSELGANYLASALIRSKKIPSEVIIPCCGFKGSTAVMISEMLELNRSIVKLDITANDFSGEAGQKFVDSLSKNRRLLEVDTRETKISEENKIIIRELLERNKQYLIWEYNPKNPDHEPGHYPPRVAENFE